MSDERSRSRRRSRFQYSFRSLIIATTILGPLIAIYGPTSYRAIREYFSNDVKVTTVQKPLTVLDRLSAQMNTVIDQNLLVFESGDLARIPVRTTELSIHTTFPSSPHAVFRFQSANFVPVEVERGMQADFWEQHERLGDQENNVFD